jgi:hypothetical protein
MTQKQLKANFEISLQTVVQHIRKLKQLHTSSRELAQTHASTPGASEWPFDDTDTVFGVTWEWLSRTISEYWIPTAQSLGAEVPAGGAS